MKPLALLLPLAIAGVCFGADAPAAPAPASAPSAAADPGLADNRPISSSAAAMLSAGMPHWSPPPPPAPAPKPKAEDEPEDQPRNHIVRLPKYMVHAPPPPIFREKDLYSPEALAQLALLRYKGLSLLPLADMNSKIGSEMLREDQRLQSISSLNDTADAMARGGDKAEADYIRGITQSSYSQSSSDWGGPVPQNPSARSFPGDH